MLGNLKGLIFSLKFHADVQIESWGIGSQSLVVGILHKATSELAIGLGIEELLDVVGVEVLDDKETTTAVDHGLLLAVAVHKHKGHDAEVASHAGIVGAKVGCNVHNASTIRCSNVVARDNLEGFTCGLTINAEVGLGKGQELLIAHAHKILAIELGQHGIGDNLVASLIVIEILVFALFIEVGRHKVASQHNHLGRTAIGVVGLYNLIDNLFAHTESCVGGQCPRCCGPSQEVERQPLSQIEKGLALGVLNYAKLCCKGGILDVAITTRLVKFVA